MRGRGEKLFEKGFAGNVGEFRLIHRKGCGLGNLEIQGFRT
jgi:hypothetical protein